MYSEDGYFTGYCRWCKAETNERGPFGEWLCGPCWEDEDDAIAGSSSNI